MVLDLLDTTIKFQQLKPGVNVILKAFQCKSECFLAIINQLLISVDKQLHFHHQNLSHSSIIEVRSYEQYIVHQTKSKMFVSYI